MLISLLISLCVLQLWKCIFRTIERHITKGRVRVNHLRQKNTTTHPKIVNVRIYEAIKRTFFLFIWGFVAEKSSFTPWPQIESVENWIWNQNIGFTKNNTIFFIFSFISKRTFYVAGMSARTFKKMEFYPN